MKIAALGLAAILALSTTAASAATYSFGMIVGSVSIDGFFVVDDSSSNYVGGGTTTQLDLVDYSFTFAVGADTFVGTPVNLLFLQTFDVTYSSDLSTVTTWDISIGFQDSNGDLGFAGNNIGSGFATVVDFATGTFNAFVSPAPLLTAELQDAPSQTPLPAALPLFATGLGALGLLGWRRRKRTATAA